MVFLVYFQKKARFNESIKFKKKKLSCSRPLKFGKIM